MSGQKEPISSEKQESIIKELCTSNGIQFAQLEGNGPVVKQLEMFFSGYPHMVGLKHFPNLTSLVVVGQSLSHVESLQHCPGLKELWLCECQLKNIHGLEGNKKLNKLFLYSNQISKIENLSLFPNLELLDLSKNCIETLQGIGSLKPLKDFNVAGNCVTCLGCFLDPLVHLEKFNVAGNKLTSFKDLTNLAKLKMLKDLTLKDSLYRHNPVCLLCNYSTHILFHLPNLERLDTVDVPSLQMRDLAEATVVKKKMYYYMRVKTVRRNLSNLINRLTKEKRHLLQIPEEKLRSFHFSLKSIEQQQEVDNTDGEAMECLDNETEDKFEAEVKFQNGLHEEEDLPVGDSATTNVKREEVDGKRLACKLDSLRSRILAWNRRTEEVEAYYNQACDLLHAMANTSVRRLTIELESGGNVRFEQGSQNDVWYSTCHDLVLSRFCAWDYKLYVNGSVSSLPSLIGFGMACLILNSSLLKRVSYVPTIAVALKLAYDVTGIKMHGITRIHNRVLRCRFDDKVHSIGSDDGGLPANKSYKKLVDYLFYVWNPKKAGAKKELHRIVEEGFPVSGKSEKNDEGVPLSNSLFICEKPRLDYMLQESKSDAYADPCPFRYGKVIVSKVYLGKSAPAQGNGKITAERYSKIDSVYRPRKELDNSTLSQAVKADDCECSTRQCEWCVFDRNLVLPEYIIDFEYFGKKPKSPFQLRVGEWMSSGTPGSNSVSTSYDLSSLYSAEEAPDTRAINLPPKVRPRPRLVSLSEDLLLKFGKGMSLTQITVLNLHGNGLGRLKGLNSLTHLKTLVVSFNELTRLEDVAYMSHLELLDASFNKIHSLEGMRGMSKIRDLNLSWNSLTSLRDDLTVLRKHSPSVTRLDLRNNPWIKAEYLFLRVIGRLKSLTTLNDTPVTETDAAAALRLVSGTRISQTTLVTHSRLDTHTANTLSLQSQAQIIWSTSKLKADPKDSSWLSKVTTLNLDGQFIGKLAGLEKLVNLKWASFNRNCITKVEGIEFCIQLEELSLQDNCIYKVDGVAKLTKLKRLDLTSNYLSSLENVGLGHLPNLFYLSVENNRISSFKGSSEAASLIELYAGNNRVTNLREIFHLKSLNCLVILDLFGNPLVQSDNYRLFVIYHLHSLKALDGTAIESMEEGSAKDAFGGRLTNDFVAERIGHANFHEVRELDFPNCSVRTVDFGGGDTFKNLRSVNLEHNNLSSFSGLVHLRHLRVLCLNHNHVECVIPRARNQKQPLRSQYAVSHQISSDLLSVETLPPIMENLEVLHLGYNKINNMAAMQLGRLVNLKALFLQGNDIAKIEGLEGLHELRELVLDRNKIKVIHDNSFISQWNLQELHLEENRLRDLSNLHHLENLQRLYLGMNRIQDMLELEKLEGLPNLIEVSVIGNAVSRRLLHRPMLVFQLPNLQNIDGIPVTSEERTKAELYFMDQQPVMSETILPGITPHNRAGPIKVTHMSIGNERQHGLHQNDDIEHKGKKSHNRDRTNHHSLNRGALYNQIAGIKYQSGYHTHNRGLGSGNR